MVTIDATDSRSSCAHRLEALKRPMNIALPEGLTAETKTLSGWGRTNPAPLSFPIPGWTLAADVPAAVAGLLEVLDQLDEEVAAAGGRLYLAKDSRQTENMFKHSYPRFNEWRSICRNNDQAQTQSSCLNNRCMSVRKNQY